MRIFTYLSLFLAFSCIGQAQEIGSTEYKRAVASGEIELPERAKTEFPSSYTFLQTATICQPEDEASFFPIGSELVPGTEWERVPFIEGAMCSGENGWTSDDCSSAEIQLAFDYSVCGAVHNSLWVNTNGNLTFEEPNSEYDPEGIPNDLAVMVAPFWGDVDLTGNCGEVWILNTPTIFIATWSEVGYFNFNGSCPTLTNTFQVILTDGNDPIIGIDNNTGYYYGDMNWTAGEASGGIDGLGGFPAVVGINSGDDAAFAIIGEFDTAGLAYDGPLGSTDGIDFLDNKFYLFNSDNCAIESSCSIFDLDINPTECSGNTYDLAVSFVPAGAGPNGYAVRFNEEILGPFSYGPVGELTEFLIPNLPGNGQTGITIEVFDLDNSECTTDCFYDAPPCQQGCTTQAGTMLPGPTYICDGTLAFSTASGQVLDDNDVLNYALHTSATSTLGEILALNSTGEFSIGDAALETSYYISAIVGNDSGDGTVNLDDACLSVAEGHEVVFLFPMELNITEDCDENGNLTVIIRPSGGFGELTGIGSEYSGSGYLVAGTSLSSTLIAFGTQLVVSLGAFDGQSYSYNSFDLVGCETIFQSDLVSCLKTPIELTLFTAHAETKANVIQWTTGTELDNAYFELHHSTNGIDFFKIARQNGAGTSLTTNHYEFTHEDFPEGLSYYQLIQFDFNGKSSKSNIVSVYQKEEDIGPWTITLNNPVQTTLNISISSTETLEFNVFDFTGRQIFGQGIEEANFIALETDQLAHGVYFLEVSDGNRRSIHKFIKH